MIEIIFEKHTKTYWIKTNHLYTIHRALDGLSEKELESLWNKIGEILKKVDFKARMIKDKKKFI